MLRALLSLLPPPGSLPRPLPPPPSGIYSFNEPKPSAERQFLPPFPRLPTTSTRKLFVYLDQVLSSNGATRVAAGSHRQIYYAAGKSNAGVYFSDRHIEASYRVHAMEGAAGGGFIFDTNAAHRGHVDGASKGRDAIVVDMLAVPKAHALGKGVGFSCPEKIRYPLDITGPS